MELADAESRSLKVGLGRQKNLNLSYVIGRKHLGQTRDCDVRPKPTLLELHTCASQFSRDFALQFDQLLASLNVWLDHLWGIFPEGAQPGEAQFEWLCVHIRQSLMRVFTHSFRLFAKKAQCQVQIVRRLRPTDWQMLLEPFKFSSDCIRKVYCQEDAHVISGL